MIRKPDFVRRQIKGGKDFIGKASAIGRLEDQADDVFVTLPQPLRDLPGTPVIEKQENTHAGYHVRLCAKFLIGIGIGRSLAGSSGEFNERMWLGVAGRSKEPALEGAEQLRIRIERETFDRLNEHELRQSAADGNFVSHEELGAIDRAPDKGDVHGLRESFDDIQGDTLESAFAWQVEYRRRRRVP